MKHQEDHGHAHGHDHSHDCGHDHDHDCAHDHDHDFSPQQDFSDSSGETEVYSGRGVQFRYPRGWTVQEESNPDQTTITVQSPETSYWTLTLFEERPDPDEVLQSVMSAYQESYEELDVYESDVVVLGEPAIARELDFVCLDLVSNATMVVFQTLQHTVLILFQGEDRELETARPALNAITQSLLCDLD